MSRSLQPRPPQSERGKPEIATLAKLPAWERAKVCECAGVGLAERSILEAEVRARIAAGLQGKAR